MGLIPPTLKYIPVVELPAVSSNLDTPTVFLLCLPPDTARFSCSRKLGVNSEYPQARETPYKELVSELLEPGQHSASVTGVGSLALWPHGDGSDPPQQMPGSGVGV